MKPVELDHGQTGDVYALEASGGLGLGFRVMVYMCVHIYIYMHSYTCMYIHVWQTSYCPRVFFYASGELG